MKQKIDWRLIAIGIICLAVIECFALIKGIDGTLLSVIIGIITLAIGIAIPSPIKQ